MDPFLSKSQDFLIVIVLPLMVMTIYSANKERQSLWDSTVTARDRDLLMRLTMFVLMPIVVFLHECGHAAAILLFGGKIAEFHYGLLWGYVVPSGFFTPEQILIIYLGGNVVEIICGLLAFLAACFISSPPVVALLIYLAVWSISGTTIVYALMSVLGMYGDWVAIYNTAVRSWLPYIAVCHAILVLSVLYALYGKAPRLWFAKKTRPEWARRRHAMLAKMATPPTEENYLDLAWIDYEAGLDSLAADSVKKARHISPALADAIYLQGWLEVNRGNIDKAKSLFTEVSQNPQTGTILQARALMAIGQLEEDRIKKQYGGHEPPADAWKSPLEAYTAASLAEPELADPRFFRARTLNKAGLHKEAIAELEAIDDYKWLDPSLGKMTQVELSLARRCEKVEQ